MKDIRISRLAFREEHERLLKVLENPTPVNIKREAHIQRKELIKELHPKLDVVEIKAEIKKKRGKKEVDPFERKNKKNKNKK